MEESVKKKALALQERGETEKLYKLLKPYIASEDPLALHLCAGFSLKGESVEEFDCRYIKFMTMASDGGIAEASYRMGVNHLYGDYVEQGYEKARMYFERAIQQGHSYTKFTFGFSLYYGQDGNNKDEDRGLKLMREAASEGIDGAVSELSLIEGRNA